MVLENLTLGKVEGNKIKMPLIVAILLILQIVFSLLVLIFFVLMIVQPPWFQMFALNYSTPLVNSS